MKIGYFLSSEEWGPDDLVAQAVKAQGAGFEGLWISDHYHPWHDEQGHSPFVWSTIGAIAQAVLGDPRRACWASTCDPSRRRLTPFRRLRPDRRESLGREAPLPGSVPRMRRPYRRASR